MVAYFVAKAVVGDTASEAVTVKTTDEISTDVEKPDSGIFNSKAINPTVQVIIGDQSGGS
jgi:hypothetical protein